MPFYRLGRVKSRFNLALLTLAAGFECLLPARADQAATAPPAVIPCTRTVNGQLLLSVKLTGATGQKVDASFTLDTGVNKSVISDAMVARLGLKPEAGVGDDGQPITFNGGATKMARVPLMELGSIPCGPVPFVIFDARTLSRGHGQAIDGILGSNLLLAVPALINLRHNEVTFLMPGPITAGGLQAVGMGDAAAIPVDDLSGTGSYTCLARIESGGRSLEKSLVLDIGSAETMLNNSDARALGLPSEGEPTSGVTLVTGPIKVYEGKTSAISLGAGAVTARDVMVAYPKGDLPGFLPPHLGRDVLGHYLILVDYPEKKVYLKPASRLDAPTFIPKITIGGK